MELQHEYLRNARRKVLEKRGYFDDDDDYEGSKASPGGSAARGPSNAGLAAANGAAEAEIDPLDAFMAGIDAQVSQEKAQASAAKRPAHKPSRIFEDEHDSYLEDLARSHKKARPTSAQSFADSDEEVYSTAKQMDDSDEDNDLKKTIEVLAPLNHSEIEYESFRKQFYKPHADITAMSDSEVRELRKELGISTDGTDVPRPIRSFVEVGFDRKMLGMLMKLGLEAPTPIQAQAFPIAMSGRDMIGIAKTGSGKTLAFTLPMVVHVMDQRELRKDEGPIAIVLSPTRELAHQIFGQAKKFLNVYGAQCAAIYGGVGKWDQIQALRKGAEVVVATPGRLIDMIRKKNVKTKRVTFVVLDEADRMFEMGFEPQLRSIMGQVRPDRQTLMFSATFRKRVESLARDVLENPIKITVGQIGQANEDIHQIAVVLANHAGKWPWLMANLQRITSEGRVLIFASSKTGCEELTKNLNAMKYLSSCLHGDKNQQERNEALAKFRSGEVPILVATDVASRGLDVKDVKTVVNYDVAKNIDTHVHRIGRTGRMGAEGFEPGTAYTLVTKNESQFAAQLVYNMDVSGQAVSPDLLALAKRDSRFRRGVPASGGRDSGPHSRGERGEPSIGGAVNDFDALDEDDEAEMKRWNASQKKSKADQRKGLGFGSSGSSGTNNGGGFRMSFVKASSASTLQESFRSAFVKSSTSSDTVPTPSAGRPQPPHPPKQAFAPPPLPDQATAKPVLPPSLVHPPPLPPAIVQTALVPPHVTQAHQNSTNVQLEAQPVVPSSVSPAEPPRPPDAHVENPPKTVTEMKVHSEHGRSTSTSRCSSSRHGRRSRSSSRSYSRSRSRSRSHSRRRSRSRSRRRRSRSRESRRRHRSRSRSRSRTRSRSRSRTRSSRRSRSRSRGHYYRR